MSEKDIEQWKRSIFGSAVVSGVLSLWGLGFAVAPFLAEDTFSTDPALIAAMAFSFLNSLVCFFAAGMILLGLIHQDGRIILGARTLFTLEGLIVFAVTIVSITTTSRFQYTSRHTHLPKLINSPQRLQIFSLLGIGLILFG